ncbi:conserved protein, unknown function [Plasmodium reichenowi]|uniref:Uncharacterized protein n=1 Tax=Plasmodium reichenowi TaxID=5854 RepID=A0A060RXU2_PLARE|nr:hypothetical protein PRSY57_1350100 [Plasmodium reichenowi]KYN94934.1 hypothetical protein PRSY57_1350100 [Plasmodium reichenowi]CAC9699121.1 conserved protein, unknown function [Plasmodium sp. DRC-Itaito]CDO66295.1 conserved Plasmodium protein, unknown function [Plasmodium reichenowi]SOV82139.1 conserved protein, unknown function [Plasmodium reichenowi]
MKNTVVRIKAELENVKRLFCDDEYLWIFNIRDSTSSLTRDNIQFRKTDILEIPNSRGTANFMIKWTEYPKYSTINFVNTKNSCSYEEVNNNEWRDFASFECRGIELIDFIPSNNFIVEDTKGKLYYDVNLSDQNWCDYNEEHEMCVGIYNLEYEVN